MQDTMRDKTTGFGLASQEDIAQSRNLAAIALAEAINRARLQQSERHASASEAASHADRNARISSEDRLQQLRRKMEPLYAAIPQEVELFDLGFISAEKPRLFVDIIAFVEMSMDQNQYRFVKEARSGRSVMLETGDETVLIAHITDYIARRLIERENAIEDAGKSEPVTPMIKAYAPLQNGEADTAHSLAAPVKAHAEPSMTAAEAFRQWSSAGKAVPSLLTAAVDDAQMPAPVSVPLAVEEHVSSHALAAPAMRQSRVDLGRIAQTVQSISETDVKPSIPVQADPVQSTLTQTIRPVAIVQPATPVMADVLATPVLPAPVLPTPVLPAAVLPPIVAAPRSNGWWFWPVLALLLGIGLGIAALYAYASTLVR